MSWFLEDDLAPAVEAAPARSVRGPTGVEAEPADPPAAPHPPPSPAPSARRGLENHYTAAFGKKGTGKTLYVRAMHRARVAAGGSAVFVDRTGNNLDLGFPCGGRRSGRPVAEFCAYARGQVRAGLPINAVVVPSWGESELDELWPVLYDLGGLLLVLDEAEQFANTQRIDSNLEELVSLGRNREVDIAAVVRTPPELSHRLTGNLDVCITFRQPNARYAKTLNDRFFHLPDGESRILRLPRLHYLRAHEGRVSGGRVHIPR